MLKAAKLQKKVSKVGFDWPDARSILDKVREELDEVEEAFDAYQEGGEVPDALQAEIGDLLFVVVNVARKLGVNPEAAIERTNLKFEERFQRLETSLRERGISLAEATSEEMEREWVNAKAHDRR